MKRGSRVAGPPAIQTQGAASNGAADPAVIMSGIETPRVKFQDPPREPVLDADGNPLPGDDGTAPGTRSSEDGADRDSKREISLSRASTASQLDLLSSAAIRRSLRGEKVTLPNPTIHAPWRLFVFHHIITKTWFETFIIIVIILNCITLALGDPKPGKDEWLWSLQSVTEPFFAAVFTLEMVLKWCAIGVTGRYSYFKDNWNWLDFIIVVAGYVQLVPGVANVTAIRALRVLRPLRAVNKLHGLQIIVRALILSLHGLADVALLIMFLFAIYAIVGIQLFEGALHQYCYYPGGDPVLPLEACSTSSSGRLCSGNTTCLANGPNPSEGLIGFDNFAQAMLTVFTSMTLSDWTLTMYQLQATSNDFVWIYFCSLILLVSFFAVNLVLAVVSSVFSDVSEADRVIAEERRQAEERENSVDLEAAEALEEVKRQQELADHRSPSGDMEMTGLGPSGPSGSMPTMTSPDSTDEALSGAQAQRGTPKLSGRRQAGTRDGDEDDEKRLATALSAGAEGAAGTAASGSGAGGKHVRGPSGAMTARHVPDSKRSSRSSNVPGGPLTARQAGSSQSLVAGRDQRGSNSLTVPDPATLDLHKHRMIGSQLSSRRLDNQPAARRGPSADELNELEQKTREALEAQMGAALAEVGNAKRRLSNARRASNNPAAAAAGGGGGGARPPTPTNNMTTGGRLLVDPTATPRKDGYAETHTPRSVSSSSSKHDSRVGLGALPSKLGAGTADGSPTMDASKSQDKYAVPPMSGDVLTKGLGDTAAPQRSLTAMNTAISNIKMGGEAAEDEARFEILTRMQEMMQNKANEVHRTQARKATTTLVPPTLDFAEMREKCTPIIVDAEEKYNQMLQYIAAKPRPLQYFFHVADHKWFSLFMITVTCFNTLILAMDYYQAPPDYTSFLDVANLTCTIIFTVELVLKVLGLGPRNYFSDLFNVMDFSIVFISLLELGLGGGGSLTVFRAFRLLRVLKLVKSVTSLRILMSTVLSSLGSIGYLSLLLLLFLFMFAVLGMQLFSGAFEVDPDSGEVPRPNYDNLWNAFLAVFQVLTGDAWTSVMSLAAGSTTWAATFFFLANFILGVYIVINLFIAILLDNFNDAGDDQFELEDLRERANELVRLADYDREKTIILLSGIIGQRKLDDFLGKLKRQETAMRSRLKAYMEGKSLRVLSTSNPFRRACFNLVTNTWFEVAVITCIIVNCIIITFQTPDLDPKSFTADFIDVTDIVFASIFTFELVLKVVSFGLYNASNAYLRDAWNLLDCSVVVASWLAISFPSFIALRAFRALRPLRVIVRSDQIKTVLRSLYRALPALANVFLFCLLLWLIFGILAVDLYKGSFYACSDAALDLEVDCVGQFLDGDGNNATRRWTAPAARFDNIFLSIVTLYQCATFEGWADIMYLMIDARGPGRAPVYNHNPAAALFFVAFVIICGFFTLQLFVGVVVDNFNRLRKEYDGSAFLTAEQREWVATQKLINSIPLKIEIERPQHPLRLFCWRIVTWQYFEPLIISCIVLNMAIMCLQFYQQPDGLTRFMFAMNIVFIIIFTFEALVKISSMGWMAYWADSWNKFDFFIVCLSLFGLGFSAGVGANVVRVLRIGRVLRLVGRAKTLNRLFNTLMLSLPSVWNIGSLLFVLLFIYSVLGMQLWGKVVYSEGGLSPQANFRTFPRALLTMFRLLTGDNWNEVLDGSRVTLDCGVNLPECEPFCECGSTYAPIFYISFSAIAILTTLNLYIAVIIENFRETPPVSRTTIDKITQWSKSWVKFDPIATKAIAADKFEEVMFHAPLPFGFGRHVPRNRMLKRLQRTKIPIWPQKDKHSVRGRVWFTRFQTTLVALARSVANVVEEEEVNLAAELSEADEDEVVLGADGAPLVVAAPTGCSFMCLWCCNRNNIKDARKPMKTSTLDQWYAVQTLELEWLLKRDMVRQRSAEWRAKRQQEKALHLPDKGSSRGGSGEAHSTERDHGHTHGYGHTIAVGESRILHPTVQINGVQQPLPHEAESSAAFPSLNVAASSTMDVLAPPGHQHQRQPSTTPRLDAALSSEPVHVPPHSRVVYHSLGTHQHQPAGSTALADVMGGPLPAALATEVHADAHSTQLDSRPAAVSSSLSTAPSAVKPVSVRAGPLSASQVGAALSSALAAGVMRISPTNTAGSSSSGTGGDHSTPSLPLPLPVHAPLSPRSHVLTVDPGADASTGSATGTGPLSGGTPAAGRKSGRLPPLAAAPHLTLTVSGHPPSLSESTIAVPDTSMTVHPDTQDSSIERAPAPSQLSAAHHSGDDSGPEADQAAPPLPPLPPFP